MKLSQILQQELNYKDFNMFQQLPLLDLWEWEWSLSDEWKLTSTPTEDRCVVVSGAQVDHDL